MACSADNTLIVVTVAVDPALGLDEVAIDIESGQRQAIDNSFPVKVAGTLPVVTPVVWEVVVTKLSTSFQATVTAKGMKPGSNTAVVTAIARANVVNGQRIAVTLMLTKACEGVSCPLNQTCVSGTCSDIPGTGTSLDGGARDGAGGTGGSSRPTDADLGDAPRSDAANDSALDGAMREGAGGLLAGKILDWATWGGPFHSLLAYVRYNLVRGKSAAYGVSSWSYYFETAWSSTGLSCLAIATGVIAAWSQARALVAVAVVFLAVHCIIPHKEYRFLMPVVPLLLTLSAVGLNRLLRGWSASSIGLRHHLPVAVVGVAMSALMIVRTVDATLASTGQSTDPSEEAKSVWHHLQGPNLALAETGRQSDLCGVFLAGLSSVWSGGFTYLHRDVPFLTFESASNAGALLPYANYIILAPEVEPPAGYVELRNFRGWSVRRREGGCVPPPPPGPSRLID